MWALSKICARTHISVWMCALANFFPLMPRKIEKFMHYGYEFSLYILHNYPMHNWKKWRQQHIHTLRRRSEREKRKKRLEKKSLKSMWTCNNSKTKVTYTHTNTGTVGIASIFRNTFGAKYAVTFRFMSIHMNIYFVFYFRIFFCSFAFSFLCNSLFVFFSFCCFAVCIWTFFCAYDNIFLPSPLLSNLNLKLL